MPLNDHTGCLVPREQQNTRNVLGVFFLSSCTLGCLLVSNLLDETFAMTILPSKRIAAVAPFHLCGLARTGEPRLHRQTDQSSDPQAHAHYRCVSSPANSDLEVITSQASAQAAP